MRDELSGIREHMSKLTNDDLTRIINVDFEQYREIAIDIAREELESRMPLDESADANEYHCTNCRGIISPIGSACPHCRTDTRELIDEEEETTEEIQQQRSDEESITTSGHLHEYAGQPDKQTEVVNEDYLVTPFIGKIQSGFFSLGNAET